MTSALTGMTTDPVMRKSSTSVARTTSPMAHAARSATVARKSRMPDAWPTT